MRPGICAHEHWEVFARTPSYSAIVRLLVQGNSSAGTHLCNLFWTAAFFALMPLDFTHLSNGDMCHKVSVISAVYTCDTEPHTCSGCCEVFSWTRNLMANLTLRVSAYDLSWQQQCICCKTFQRRRLHFKDYVSC